MFKRLGILLLSVLAVLLLTNCNSDSGSSSASSNNSGSSGEIYQVQAIVTDFFGAPNIAAPDSSAMAFFKGQLYVGTYNSANGASIYRTTVDEQTWEEIPATVGGFGDVNNREISKLYAGTYQGQEVLVASTRNLVNSTTLATGTEIWATYDGDNWTQVNQDGFGEGGLRGIARDMVEFGGELYVAVAGWGGLGGAVFVSNDLNANGNIEPGEWDKVTTDGLGDVNNDDVAALAVLNGELYCATENDTDGAEVWRYSGAGTVWTQVNQDGFGNGGGLNSFPMEMVEFGGRLYIGLEKDNSAVAELWRSSEDGNTWAKVTDTAEAASPIAYASGSHDAILYGASFDANGDYGGAYRSTNGLDWEKVQTDLSGSDFVGYLFALQNGNLYGMGRGSLDGNIYRLTPP